MHFTWSFPISQSNNILRSSTPFSFRCAYPSRDLLDRVSLCARGRKPNSIDIIYTIRRWVPPEESIAQDGLGTFEIPYTHPWRGLVSAKSTGELQCVVYGCIIRRCITQRGGISIGRHNTNLSSNVQEFTTDGMRQIIFINAGLRGIKPAVLAKQGMRFLVNGTPESVLRWKPPAE